MLSSAHERAATAAALERVRLAEARNEELLRTISAMEAPNAPSDSSPPPRYAAVEDSASTALFSPALREATTAAESRRRAERPAAPVVMTTPASAPAASATTAAATASAAAATAPSATTAPSSVAAPSVECPALFGTIGDRWHDLPADVQEFLSSSAVEAVTCDAVDRVRAERLAPARQLEDEEDQKEEAGIRNALATALKATEDEIAVLQAKRASLSSQAACNREQKARHCCAVETYTGQRNRRLRDRATHDSGAGSRASSADERDIPPAPSSWEPSTPSSPPPAAVSYAAAARSHTTLGSERLLAFRKGDSAFAKGQLADMAQAIQFDFPPGDRDRVLRAAETVAIVMPPNSTVEDAVRAARARGSPFLDKVEYLLGSLRAAHGNATDPVVWPGCHRSAPPPVPAFEDFTSKKKAPVKSGGRGSGGGDSGDTDSSHLRGSTSSKRGRAQKSSSASSSSERADKKGVKKKSRTSRPSSDTAGGASSDSGYPGK
ncbi:unnamed protein product [Ectocarpus sp. CCAP 1310/34]|nr:unnamed protein product [Ectocarpus sp. CCAP 1310/34]